MKYIIICGPTCSGKTALGIALARRFDGELIGADSRQIYRGLDIGTAKPKPDEYAGLRYHLIDFLELHQEFSAHQYATMARKQVEEIVNRGKVPIVVGGTGLYLKALTEGLFAAPTVDKDRRQILAELAERVGVRKLHTRLAEIDPEAAARIAPTDARRIIRALEVYELTGKPISLLQKQHNSERFGKPLWLGLCPPRSQLYANINQRVNSMLDQGWEQELLRLRQFVAELRRIKPVGYTVMISYLFDRQFDREEAIEKVKQAHRNYAKRQMTWFRKVPGIIWLDPLAEGFWDKVCLICDDYLKRA